MRHKHKTSQVDTPNAAKALPRSLWASPAGKYRTAKYLASLLPPHHTYVEPFAGSAAVLFAKPRAPVEVVSDLDPEIAEAFRCAAQLSQDDCDALSQRDWTGQKSTFSTLKSQEPANPIDALYRFIYTNHFSFLKGRKHFSPSAAGKVYAIKKRLTAATPRLVGVVTEGGDYERVIRKYDGEHTVFFFDPPYAGTDGGVGERLFDEARFFEVLKGLRGKFLMTYGTRGELVKLCESAGFDTQQQFWKRDHIQTKGLSGCPRLSTCLVANFEIPRDHQSETIGFDKTLPIIKVDSTERFVLGVVLEPDVVDAQNDIYSASDIRKAAHGFMQSSQVMGHMHQWRVNDKVKILESYLLPSDCQFNDLWLRKGTWMLGVRVLDDALWDAVNRGELTGFSVGGSADRVPIADGLGGKS
jgi:DNA adenine methylase